MALPTMAAPIKHRPHLLGILSDARAPAPIAMQLLRQIHELLHLVKHDAKLAELRTEYQVHLQARVMSIAAGGATAAAVLSGLADFSAFVVKYVFEINAQQSVAEARDNLEAAGDNLMRIMRRVPSAQRASALKEASGELLRAKDAAESCSLEYDDACKDVAANGHAATTALLSLLTDATDERELSLQPSLLGKLVIHSRPELFRRAIDALLNVKGATLPAWLPAAILDYAVVGVELEDVEGVVEWLKTCLDSSRSHAGLASAWDMDESGKDESGAVRAYHDQTSAATLCAWAHALQDAGRRQTFVYVCMHSRDLHPAVMLHRLYCAASPYTAAVEDRPKWWPPPLHVIEETIDMLLTRSIPHAQSLIDIEHDDRDGRSVVPSLVVLLTLWCEVLTQEHAPQKFAQKLLSGSPRLFSQIVVFVAKECPGALAVWMHLAALLELSAQDRLPKTCVEWLAASVWQCHETLEQEPIYVELEARPREPVALADFAPWQQLVRLAKPLVPDAWYGDQERGSPASHGHSFSAELDAYEQQKRLAHAQFEAEEAAAAEALRAQREAEEREAQAQAQVQHEAQMAALQEHMKEMLMKQQTDAAGTTSEAHFPPHNEGDEPAAAESAQGTMYPVAAQSQARSELSDDEQSDEDGRMDEPLIIHSNDLTDAVAAASGIVDEVIESAWDRLELQASLWDESGIARVSSQVYLGDVEDEDDEEEEESDGE